MNISLMLMLFVIFRGIRGNSDADNIEVLANLAVKLEHAEQEQEQGPNLESGAETVKIKKKCRKKWEIIVESVESCNKLEFPKNIPKRCKECDKTLNSLAALKQHGDEQHPTKKMFHCLYEGCGKSFTELSSLGRHEISDHGRLKKYYKRYLAKSDCRKCGEEFYSMTDLKDHFKRKHPGEKLYKCEHCSATFFQNSHKGRHEREIHPKGGKKRKIKQKDDILFRDRIDMIKGRYHCQYDGCRSIFSHKRSLRLHERQKHGRKVVKKEHVECWKCGLKCSCKSKLYKHYREHHPLEKMFFCSLCDATYADPRGLRRHEHTAHRQKLEESTSKTTDPDCKQKCEECGETFPLKTQLYAHYKSDHQKAFNRGEKCESEVKGSYETGNLPAKFNCQYCPITSARKDNPERREKNLGKIRREKTDTTDAIVAYRCIECNKGYEKDDFDLFKRHRDGHWHYANCPICKRGFQRNLGYDRFENHVRIHHEDEFNAAALKELWNKMNYDFRISIPIVEPTSEKKICDDDAEWKREYEEYVYENMDKITVKVEKDENND